LTIVATVKAVFPGAGVPTGIVNIYDGTTLIASPALPSSGGAALYIRTLSASVHSLSAVYSGDSNFFSSTSSPIDQVINPVPVCNCDDKNPCTQDTCLPGGKCQNTVITCNDGNACTQDVCNKQTQTTYTCVNNPIPNCGLCLGCDLKYYSCSTVYKPKKDQYCSVYYKDCDDDDDDNKNCVGIYYQSSSFPKKK